jgi:hypothetical protein
MRLQATSRSSRFRTICVTCKRANSHRGFDHCRSSLGHTEGDWGEVCARPLAIAGRKRSVPEQFVAGPASGKVLPREGSMTGAAAGVGGGVESGARAGATRARSSDGYTTEGVCNVIAVQRARLTVLSRAPAALCTPGRGKEVPSRGKGMGVGRRRYSAQIAQIA